MPAGRDRLGDGGFHQAVDGRFGTLPDQSGRPVRPPDQRSIVGDHGDGVGALDRSRPPSAISGTTCAGALARPLRTNEFRRVHRDVSKLTPAEGGEVFARVAAEAAATCAAVSRFDPIAALRRVTVSVALHNTELWEGTG